MSGSQVLGTLIFVALVGGFIIDDLYQNGSWRVSRESVSDFGFAFAVVGVVVVAAWLLAGGLS